MMPALSDELKARLRLGDPTLWLVRSYATKHPTYCLAEETEPGGLTWRCDLAYQKWSYTYTVADQDIEAYAMAYHGLRWVVAPPWLDK